LSSPRLLGRGALVLILAPALLTSASAQEDEQRVLRDLADDGLGVGDADLHPPSPREDNGARELQAACDLYAGLSEDAQFQLHDAWERRTDLDRWELMWVYEDDAERQRLTALLAGARRQLADLPALVDRALVCGSWVPEVDWPRGYEVPLEHLMPHRDVVVGLLFLAVEELAEGNAREGWRHILRAGTLADRQREPLLICWLVRQAMLNTVCEVAAAAIQLAPPPRGERLELDHLLQRMEWAEGYTWALRGELFAALTSLPDDEQSLQAFLEAEGAESELLAGAEVSLPWLRANRARIAEVLAAAIRASQLPALEARAEVQALHEELLERRREPDSLLASLLMPSLVRIHDKALETTATLRMTRVALAMSAQATLPEALPPGARPDPFTGDPLGWTRVDPHTGRLWSTGPDLTDEGGSGDTDEAEGTDLVLEVRLPR
jgi:hypothetical protein